MSNSPPTGRTSYENLAATLAAAAGVGIATDPAGASLYAGLEQYIVFDLDEWRLAAPLTSLVSVERLTPALVPTPIPNGPPWLDGILSLRGEIVSAVDLRTYLGLRRRVTVGRNAEGRGRLLLASSGDIQVGLIVDDIREVVFVDPAHVTAPAEHHPATVLTLFPATIAPFLRGIYRDPQRERSLALLDLARFITHPRMTDFSGAAG